MSEKRIAGKKRSVSLIFAPALFALTFIVLFGCTNPWMEDIFKKKNKEIIHYIVTFNSDGGSGVDPQTLTEGEKAIRPRNPSKTDWGFVNWYDNEDLIDPRYDFDTPVAEDLTLYAKWSDIFYTITFDGNNGDFEIVGEGGTMPQPPDPIGEEGAIFGGWYITGDYLPPSYDFENNPVTEDLTLYAKWIIPVTGVSLDKNSLTMTVGGTGELIATVLPASATNKTVTWSSSNPSVATVSVGSDGVSATVTAVNAGTATITVTTADGGKKATCVVAVDLPALAGTVTINGTAEVGQTLTADTSDLNGSGTVSYQWKRGTTNIGANATYVVQAADVGSTITVTVTRTGYTGSVTSDQTTAVTVPFVPVTFIFGVTTDAVVGIPLKLTGTVNPANATNKTIIWSVSTDSENSIEAQIEDDTFTAKSEGHVNVNATITNGKNIGENHTQSFLINVADATTPPGTATLTLTVAQIEKGDPEITDVITISRSGTPTTTPPSTYAVTAPTGYDTYSWKVAGVGGYPDITGTDSTFTLNAVNVNYNTLGGHTLELTVTKDVLKYMVNIRFTIEE